MNNRYHLSLLLLIVFDIIAFTLSMLMGSVPVDFIEAFNDSSSISGVILFSVRFPRTIACFFAGVAFAISGTLLQAATGNDLASPNIIGLNSGAGFAVLLFLSVFPFCFDILPVVAFLGGMLALVIVFLISSFIGRVSSSHSIILAGIAVNALFNAFISVISSLDPDVLSTYSSFSVGGFASVNASMLCLPRFLIAIAVIVSFFLSRLMDIIMLGDEIASSMGYRPMIIRIIVVAIAALLAASAVTFSGLLGFVGLVTPHIARMLGGGESRKTLSLSLFAGPFLVLLSDILARTVIRPSELPAGIFMAIIGVPFFIALLIRRARS